MTSRVNVGVQRYNMPSNIYEMSKDAYDSSLKGSIGKGIGKLSEAIEIREARKKIKNKQNFAKAKELAKSKAFTGLEFSGSGMDENEENEIKNYDPFTLESMIDDADTSEIEKLPSDELEDLDPFFMEEAKSKISGDITAHNLRKTQDAELKAYNKNMLENKPETDEYGLFQNYPFENPKKEPFFGVNDELYIERQ